MKLIGLVIVGLGSLFFFFLGVAEMAGGDLSGFQHLLPAALFGALAYVGRRHPYPVGIVLVIIAFGLASLYAAGFIGSDEPVGTRIAWALQVALPPLVAGALLIGSARGRTPSRIHPSPPHRGVAS
jgi:peptidoglycan/LPS O-acetylase OafA/YrhL